MYELDDRQQLVDATDRETGDPRQGGAGERWRVLGLETGPPQALLARGVALLEQLAHDAVPVLRWYRADTPAVVFGRGQILSPADATSLATTSRFSGGGAVLMDERLLCLDVLLPAGHALLAGDLATVFVRVGSAWAQALVDLGVSDVSVFEGAGRARRRGTPREQVLASVCYATLGRGEVTVAGRKLVGLAQRRRRPGALVQCGLVRRWEPGALLEALALDPADSDFATCAVGLDEVLTDPPDDALIMQAVTARLTCADARALCGAELGGT